MRKYVKVIAIELNLQIMWLWWQSMARN